MSMDKEERKAKVQAEIEKERKGWAPRSPLASVFTGLVFGVLYYLINNQDERGAIFTGVFFALGLSFIDYCYVYYKRKEK